MKERPKFVSNSAMFLGTFSAGRVVATSSSFAFSPTKPCTSKPWPNSRGCPLNPWRASWTWPTELATEIFAFLTHTNDWFLMYSVETKDILYEGKWKLTGIASSPGIFQLFNVACWEKGGGGGGYNILCSREAFFICTCTSLHTFLFVVMFLLLLIF